MSGGGGAAPRGPGRPSLGPAALTQKIQVRTTSDMRRRILALAAAAGQSESAWGLAAFERALAIAATPE